MRRYVLGLFCSLLLACLHAPAVLAGEPALSLFTEEYPPITFSRGGRATGLVTEVVEEIQRRIGDTSQIQVVPWARGYRHATLDPNVGLFATTRTAERENLFKWVGPVSSTRAYLYGRRADGKIVSTLEAARLVQRIVVPREWYLDQMLKGMGFTNIDTVTVPLETLRILQAGRANLAALDDITVAATAIGGGIDASEFVPLVQLSEAIQFIAFSRKTPDAVVVRWQGALDDMKRDGTYAKIFHRWLPDPLPPSLAAPSTPPANPTAAAPATTPAAKPSAGK